VTFVHNPPSWRNDAGHVWLVLTPAPAAPLPPDSNSSKPESEYLGQVDRWHVYFLASANALKAWPTAKDDVRRALATSLQAEPKLAIILDADRVQFAQGEEVSVMLTIRNLGPTEIEAPAVYWSAQVVVDGKSHRRLPQFMGDWNGPGKIISQGDYRSDLTLSEYGVRPGALAVGDHTLSVKIANVQSPDLAIRILPPGAQED
jgi:hypothetical protein